MQSHMLLMALALEHRKERRRFLKIERRRAERAAAFRGVRPPPEAKRRPQADRMAGAARRSPEISLVGAAAACGLLAAFAPFLG